MPPAIYAIWIINKSGGLIYNRVRSGRGGRGRQEGRGRRATRQTNGRCILSLTPVSLSLAQEFTPAAKAMDLNDTLRVASIW